MYQYVVKEMLSGITNHEQNSKRTLEITKLNTYFKLWDTVDVICTGTTTNSKPWITAPRWRPWWQQQDDAKIMRCSTRTKIDQEIE